MNPARRGILKVAGFAILGSAPWIPTGEAWAEPSMSASMLPVELAFVGCRTSRARGAHGKGISTYVLEHDGSWRLMSITIGPDNPSFLCTDRTKRFLYAVHGDETSISAYRIGPDGMLTFLDSAGTDGRNPVYILPSLDNRFMLVANYATGSIAALPIDGDGRISPPAALLELDAKPGPNPIEQASPHPHQISFDPQSRYLYVPDKGSDRIYTLVFDPARPSFHVLHELETAAGSGPRHIAFHPTGKFAFVSYELSSQVGVYRCDLTSGRLTLAAPYSTLPPDATIKNTAAEVLLSPDGGTVYVTNRGHDSIMVAAFHPQDAALASVRWIASGGHGPRFALFDNAANHLLVANELSDGLSVFGFRDDRYESPEMRHLVATGSPVCIVRASIGRKTMPRDATAPAPLCERDGQHCQNGNG